MNKLKLTSCICGGIISLTGANGLAQSSSTSGATSSTDSTGQSTAPSSLNQSASPAATSSANGHWQHSGQHVRLSHLLNSPVQSQDGKTLGSIRDFTVDPQSGHIQFAILSLSAAGSTDTATAPGQTLPSRRSSNLGSTTSTTDSMVSGKLIPVPWQLFSQSWDNASAKSTASGLHGSRNLVLNLDEAKLQSAPSFDASNWSDMQQNGLDQRVYSYYGVSRMSGAGTSGSSISGQGTGSTGSTRGASSNDPSKNDYGTGNATGGTGAKGGAADLQK